MPGKPYEKCSNNVDPAQVVVDTKNTAGSTSSSTWGSRPGRSSEIHNRLKRTNSCGLLEFLDSHDGPHKHDRTC